MEQLNLRRWMVLELFENCQKLLTFGTVTWRKIFFGTSSGKFSN